MPGISRGRALAYAGVVLVALAVGGRFVGGGEEDSHPRTARAHRGTLEAEPAEKPKVVVHVVGAVERPGLYTLADGSRVDDALRSAGGPKAKAALELVNLAAPVADGQQVVVPVRGERGGAAAAGSGSAAAAGASSGPGSAPAAPVRLNSATLEQLDALPGIGPVTAQKILDYRTAKGAFSSVDELDAVPGIGPARLEQLKPLVAL